MVSQSSSVGYTIMGKTADLTVVQKTTIDTLHKEGKTQKVIAKEAGCLQSSVSKNINREAKGRKRCGRYSNYMTSTCIYISYKTLLLININLTKNTVMI